MAREIHTLVDVHKHQFSLVDEAREDFEVWTNDWGVVHVGVSPQTLTVFTARADGRVPLTVRLLAEEPTVDLERWSGVVEGAHLHCPSGRLRVDELMGDPSRMPTLAIEPVPHAGLVCFGDVDSAGYDMRDGADHYLILLWPGRPTTPVARKKHRHAMDVRLEPRLSIGEALARVESPEPHDRFHAVAELARHGGSEAIARLVATEGEVDRHHACCALALAHPLPMGALETFATDASARVRTAALVVLHDALFAVDSGERESLDVDRCYDLVRPRLSDPDPEPRSVAESVLRELDAMADDMRELTEGEPGPPGQISAVEATALAFLDRLTQRGLLKTTAGYVPERAAEAVIETVAAAAHATSGLGSALADALVDVRGVDELFASDEELEAALRER